MRSAAQIKHEALAFRLWREAKSVDFDCTAGELAEACNVPVGTVRGIARERRWPLTVGKQLPNARYGSAKHRLRRRIAYPDVQPVDKLLRGTVA